MVKNSKTLLGSLVPYFSCCRPDTTRFVDVPISVTVPPSTVANDIGMSSFFALIPQLRIGLVVHGWVGEMHACTWV